MINPLMKLRICGKKSIIFALKSLLILSFFFVLPFTCQAKENADTLASNIIVEDGASEDMANKVSQYYSLVPENVRVKIEQDGWKIVISNTKLNKRFGYKSSILALTVYQEKTIYIDNRKKASSSIIHEIGHVIDASSDGGDGSRGLCLGSFGNNFKAIKEAEENAFVKTFNSLKANTTRQDEYFAESYMQCILNMEQMQKNCPQTYNYIMTISNSMYATN